MENPRKNGVSYEFGQFRVDASQRLLFREGRPVPLSPKVVETLLALVECGGALVTKDTKDYIEERGKRGNWDKALWRRWPMFLMLNRRNTTGSWSRTAKSFG